MKKHDFSLYLYVAYFPSGLFSQLEKMIEDIQRRFQLFTICLSWQQELRKLEEQLAKPEGATIDELIEETHNAKRDEDGCTKLVNTGCRN